LTASTIIIGAGPAGLAAAIASGRVTLLLERNPYAGRKLLLSGNGQCNLTNSLPREEFLARCGKSAPFLKPAFHAFDNTRLIELLGSNGCPLLIREDGKVFPASLKSADVRDTLLKLASAAGARLIPGTQIATVQKDRSFLLRSSDGSTFKCDRLILACGGASYPDTGSDGSSYRLASQLGHAVKAPLPALAAVFIQESFPYAQLAGVSVRNTSLSFGLPGHRHRRSGDLLFTHQGLSGPLILDNSHLLNPGNRIHLHLLPEADRIIPDLLAKNQKTTLNKALKRLRLPHSLLLAILQLLGVDPAQTCCTTSKSQRNRIAQALLDLEFTISGIESLDTAMATHGGIPLKEVRSKTMESRVCPGLFLAGELLDYDLPTGGFNIQMAISTGYLAGSQFRK
jgi:predicted Rossmann fold flavoprotein